ncbi:amidase [Mesorhizobium sp. KR2-14]|uniref:amidase n=1 Tax=Mesorhizobium sp. KR2-14 TaxID=3156610 RepID=UPI0032B39F93
MAAPNRPATKLDVPPAGEICRMPAVELVKKIKARQLSAREVATAFLDRIDAVNPKVNAIVSLRDRAEILAEADAADSALANGAKPGPLHGLPIAIKDLALTKGLKTTFGSPIFADFVPDEDDFFVVRMRAAGAIFIGKTNTPEFGLGSNTYNNVFGATLNAFDPALTAGGSSGGAAVALALDMVPVADGSDFGGSLRNPAAFNNVFGLRPSQGLVPAGPMNEVFHSQMGIEGPMGRNVRDMALLLDVQAGHDARAPLSLDGETAYLDRLEAASAGGRIAWFGDLGGHLPVETGILELCEAGLRRFAEIGFAAEPLVPEFDFEALWRAFVTLRQATSGCELKAHFDNPARRDLLKPEAIWEIEGAMRLTAVQVHAASTVRSKWHATLLKLFERFDLLALPTAQVFPFPVGTHWPKQVAGRAMDSYHRWMEVSAYATLAGCPSVNVPVGFDPQGLPMGMQIIGRPRGDLAVLQAAAAYETVLPWAAGA